MYFAQIVGEIVFDGKREDARLLLLHPDKDVAEALSEFYLVGRDGEDLDPEVLPDVFGPVMEDLRTNRKVTSGFMDPQPGVRTGHESSPEAARSRRVRFVRARDGIDIYVPYKQRKYAALYARAADHRRLQKEIPPRPTPTPYPVLYVSHWVVDVELDLSVVPLFEESGAEASIKVLHPDKEVALGLWRLIQPHDDADSHFTPAFTQLLEDVVRETAIDEIIPGVEDVQDGVATGRRANAAASRLTTITFHKGRNHVTVYVPYLPSRYGALYDAARAAQRRNPWNNRIEAAPAPIASRCCAACGKTAGFTCSACTGADYCSAVCQSRHWGAHQTQCR
jgi:hypothetical protein